MNELTQKLKHIAFIMDGNRTWAKSKGLPKMMGHTEGIKSFKKIVEHANNLHIPYITFWALSTENLKNRSETELKHLFSLFSKLIDYIEELRKENIKFNVIGNISKIPNNVQENLNKLKEQTKNHTGMTLTLAVNYGGRDELVRAVNNMLDLKLEKISEENFNNYLDTTNLPDVDLVIRTSGHQRLSGYLPWQTTYAELYFTKTKWPAFKANHLDEAIDWFLEQKRNKGK